MRDYGLAPHQQVETLVARVNCMLDGYVDNEDEVLHKLSELLLDPQARDTRRDAAEIARRGAQLIYLVEHLGEYLGEYLAGDVVRLRRADGRPRLEAAQRAARVDLGASRDEGAEIPPRYTRGRHRGTAEVPSRCGPPRGRCCTRWAPVTLSARRSSRS